MTLRRTKREWIKEGEIEREETKSSDDGEDVSSDKEESSADDDGKIEKEDSSGDKREEEESSDDDREIEREEEDSIDDKREEKENSDDEEEVKREEESSGDDEREKEAYKRYRNIKKNPIEVEFYRTSDDSKIDWQTKQQMGEYGLLGGCCRKGDHFNDKTHKCRRRSCSPRATVECRARSLSRPSRDKTRKSLHGILKRNNSKPPVRSRSVCFSEKNEEFSVEFDYDSEEEDTSEYGLLSGEVGRPYTEIIFQPSSENKAEINRNQKNKLNINEYRTRRRINESEEKFHGFHGEDITNEMAQLTLRTLIIQMENKDESAREEFAEDYYDVIMETTLGDYSDGLFENAETHADVQNDSILEKNKSYVTPLNNSTSIEENLAQNPTVEANEGSFLGTDTLMEIQETNLALDDSPTQLFSNETTQKEQFSEDVKIANFKISRLLVNKLKLNINCEISQAEYVNNPIKKTLVLIKQEPGVDPSSLPLVGVGTTDDNSNIIPLLMIKQEPGVDSSSPEIVDVGSTDTNSNKIPNTSLLIKQEPGVDSSPLKIVPHGSTDTIGESPYAEKTPSHAPGEPPSHIPGEKPSCVPGEPPSHAPGETPSHVPGEPPLYVPGKPPYHSPRGPPSHLPGETPFHVPGEPPGQSNVSREIPCSTVASSKSQNDCVTCSTCSSIFLSGSIGLEQTLENSSQWQCQDCAICILCFVRTEGDGLLMCCTCGRYYHKPCVMMEEDICDLFICKFCTTEEGAI